MRTIELSCPCGARLIITDDGYRAYLAEAEFLARHRNRDLCGRNDRAELIRLLLQQGAPWNHIKYKAGVGRPEIVAVATEMGLPTGPRRRGRPRGHGNPSGQKRWGIELLREGRGVRDVAEIVGVTREAARQWRIQMQDMPPWSEES